MVVVFDNHLFFQVDAGKARRRLSRLRAVTKGGFHLAEFLREEHCSPPAPFLSNP